MTASLTDSLTHSLTTLLKLEWCEPCWIWYLIKRHWICWKIGKICKMQLCRYANMQGMQICKLKLCRTKITKPNLPKKQTLLHMLENVQRCTICKYAKSTNYANKGLTASNKSTNNETLQHLLISGNQQKQSILVWLNRFGLLGFVW